MSVLKRLLRNTKKVRLPNYLRADRRRLSLSQRDMAFLLGCKSSAKVSRYERFKVEPKLETAFMCGFITCEPLNELFEGIYDDAVTKVKRRARILLQRYRRMQTSASVERTIATLESICSRDL